MGDFTKNMEDIILMAVAREACRNPCVSSWLDDSRCIPRGKRFRGQGIWRVQQFFGAFGEESVPTMMQVTSQLAFGRFRIESRDALGFPGSAGHRLSGRHNTALVPISGEWQG